LQSTAHGRYDILFAFPGESLELDADGNVTAPEFMGSPGRDYLTAFDDWWQQEKAVDQDETGLPFTGGWFVYLGYELAGQVEPCLQLPQSTDKLPVAIATRFRTAVIRDNEQQQSFIVAEQGYATSVCLSAESLQALGDNA
jgi:anthranilate synthase component 1